MQITFDDYAKIHLEAILGWLERQRLPEQLYTKKFDEMMLRVNGKINYTLYKNTNEKYVLYIMMPSEKDENIFYDVVIEFTTNDDVQKDLIKLVDMISKYSLMTQTLCLPMLMHLNITIFL